jgi:hypothetical protein
MGLLYIYLNKDSPAFVKGLLAVNKDEDLLKKIMHVCAENNNKEIFIWADMEKAISYLESIRKRNLFCWFYLLYNIIDKTVDGYDVKLLIKPELVPTASKAMDLYQKRFPINETKNHH